MLKNVRFIGHTYTHTYIYNIYRYNSKCTVNFSVQPDVFIFNLPLPSLPRAVTGPPVKSCVVFLP